MVEQRVAVVTGANRGLGFETVRQLAQAGLAVILTSRDGLMGKAAADKLQSEGLTVAYQPLDITRDESVIRLREHLENAYGRLDVLVNNAGIFPEIAAQTPASVLDAEPEQLRASLETNTFGALRVTQELLGLMRHRGYGRIVNVSTGYAQLTGMGSGYPAYRLSKAGLNVLTRLFAAETRDENILVNSVDPGWVSTRMGGSHATTSPREAAGWIVQAACLADDGHRGCFLRRGEVIAW